MLLNCGGIVDSSVAFAGVVSHSPNDALACLGPLGSSTHLTKSASTSGSIRCSEKYRCTFLTSGATPVEACVSSSHSTLPPVSEKSPSFGMSVTWTGTFGRLCSDSKIARSLTVVLESPEPMIAIDCP